MARVTWELSAYFQRHVRNRTHWHEITRRGADPMSQQYFVKVLVVLISACLGVFSVACGVTTLRGQNAGALSTATASAPVPSQGESVALVLSKSSYALTDAIDVTIHNSSAGAITSTGQHTSCTPLTLELLAGGSWNPQGECQTLNPTQIVDIPAGASVPEHLRPTNNRGPTSAWAPGTYRVTFEYSLGDSASSGAIASVQSTEFSVA
jgi:hypothetical protein